MTSSISTESDPLVVPVGFLIELSETQNHGEVIEAFARWARVMIDCDRVAVMEARDNGYFERWSIEDATVIDQSEAFKIAGSTVGKLYKGRVSAMVDDLAAQGTEDATLVANLGLKVALYAPIICGDRNFGMIVVSYRERKANLDEDMLVLETLGRSLGTYMLLHDQVEQLSQQALTDPLTGLRNRRDFSVVAADALALWHRQAQTFSLLMVDIDRFKSVNDTFGHDVGDQVLQEIAATLSGGKRATDCLARMGGEEFCMLVRATRQDAVFEIAERIRRLVEDLKIDVAGQTLNVTVSIGCASIEQGFDSIEDLLKAADTALYRAKEGGRNRVELAHSYPERAPGS